MVCRKNLFCQIVPEWNSESLCPIVAILFDLYEKQDAARGRKRARIDFVNSNQFLSDLVNIYGQIMMGRLMPPTREAILTFLEQRFNVRDFFLIHNSTELHWQKSTSIKKQGLQQQSYIPWLIIL